MRRGQEKDPKNLVIKWILEKTWIILFIDPIPTPSYRKSNVLGPYGSGSQGPA